MKLLFLTDNFPPEVNAPANRTYEHCIEWVKQGVDVTVITCAPNFPHGKVFQGYKNKFYQKEQIDGINVIRVWTYITANEGFVKRILDYISFSIASFIAGLFISTDKIIATSPQFFTAVSGAMLSFFKRKKWIMEVRDLWPESIIAVGAMKKNIFIKLLELVEYRLYKSASHIVVVTDTFKEKISNRGIDPNKISIHKNGVDLSLYKERGKDQVLLKQLNLEGKIVIGYIGTHGLAHGLEFVLDSINLIKDELPQLVFLFIGDGAEKKKLLLKAKEKNIYNAVFHDSVPKSEVVRYLSLIDVALVNLKKNDTFLTVIPSKIFEAAAMKKPILLGLCGETKRLIQKYNAGWFYEPENREEFLSRLRIIAEGESEITQYKKGCEQLSIDFDRNKIAQSMLKTIKEV